MLKNDRDNLYRNAINTYGQRAQMLMAIEEMSELTKEICKYFRGKKSPGDMAEEIADVSIMLEQLRLMHGLSGLTEKKKEEKLYRLATRLSGSEPIKAHLSEDQISLLKTFADKDMRPGETAKELHYTTGNVTYHLKVIHKKTGLDPKTFRGLNALLKMCE